MATDTLTAPADLADALYTFVDWTVMGRGAARTSVVLPEPVRPDGGDVEPQIVRGLD